MKLPTDFMLGRPLEETEERSLPEFVEDLRKRMDQIHRFAREKLKIHSDKMKQHLDTTSTETAFKPGDASNWEGPYTIIKKINDLVSKKQAVVHLERLAKYTGHNPPNWFVLEDPPPRTEDKQRIYLIQCYGTGEECYRVVINKFNEKYPEVRISNVRAKKLVTKFLETGSVLDIKKIKKWNEDDAASVLALHSVREVPRLSLRRRAIETEISKSHLQRIFKQNRILPFKPKFRHTLEECDEAKRLDFCLEMGNRVLNDVGVHKRILFSDESIFSTNGVVSSQHCRKAFRVTHGIKTCLQPLSAANFQGVELEMEYHIWSSIGQIYADIHQLPPEEQYRYLGVCQDGRINHTQLKKEFQEKYKSRVTKLLNTLLSGDNLIKAINSWAVPVLTYSFGIVKWSVTDLDELDRLTRRLLTKFRHLHTNSSVIRLYLPRRRGGRGLLNIKNQCLNQEASLRRKLLTNRDPLITAVAREDAGYTPLSLGCELIPVDGRINHTQLKKEFQEKYKSRVTKLLNMLLSGGNLIKAINSWAVPVLTYSFGIVKWSVTDLNELDRLTRRLITKFRHLHTNSFVIRLYLPRRRGGRSLLNIKNECFNQEASLRRKLLTNKDPLIAAVAREDAGYTPLSLGCELVPVDAKQHIT
ncbi:hypothetical protein NQ318_016130 [Aromia moschata]|uniref:DUF4817 domain-containing protein n=1 Tax=Aromia moschata TaxID=1265417 RepID=A0AAV8Y005_9CUCU|nr:hypothetical protein NQ318_016130 [Aromia moschata]